MVSIRAEDIELAEFIDHALLSPTLTPEQLEQGCAIADRYGFATVCVYPIHVHQAVDLLQHSRTKVCAVIGFPSGATTVRVKQYEAQEAVEYGASELDMVISLGWLKAGKTEALHQEVAEICEAAGCPVKAILEMGLLTEPEKRLAAEVCMDAGAAFLKTSTGWHGGATVADVRLLKEITRDRIGIKAAGGIRTAAQAIDLIQAGATRLGTSRGPEILNPSMPIEREAQDNSED